MIEFENKLQPLKRLFISSSFRCDVDVDNDRIQLKIVVSLFVARSDRKIYRIQCRSQLSSKTWSTFSRSVTTETMSTQESSSKDVLTRLDSLVTGVTSSDVKCDAKRDEPTKSVSDIFAKIIRDKRKPEKPVSAPQSILKKPENNGEETDKKSSKGRIR